MRPNLITRLKEEWNNLDPVDPLRGLIADAIDALAEQPAQQQEPVAWMHTKIEGVAVPHRPADLDKHPDRWEALYKTPPPCPTCEALARTVMLDQTYHDAQRKPWVGLTDEEIQKIWRNSEHMTVNQVCRAIEAKLKEKNA